MEPGFDNSVSIASALAGGNGTGVAAFHPGIRIMNGEGRFF
jgi:hypothetical protein